MAVNKYETVIILNAVLEEQQIEAQVAKVEAYLKSHGAEIWEIERMGRKRLAYPIKKTRSGYYIIFRYDAEASFVDAFEKVLAIDELVYRCLTVKFTKESLEYLQNSKQNVEQTEAKKEDVKEETK